MFKLRSVHCLDLSNFRASQSRSSAICPKILLLIFCYFDLLYQQYYCSVILLIAVNMHFKFIVEKQYHMENIDILKRRRGILPCRYPS